MPHEIAGVYAAVLTPLTCDLIPDVHAIQEYLSHLEGQGCHGALLLGTTGEGPSFSPRERKLVMESAQVYKQSHPHFRLLVGTGTPSLEETTELTQLAFSFGADGVVVLPPYYFRKTDDFALYDWFHRLICNAVPNNGFLLVYNIPRITGISFSLELLERLKDVHPGKFAGIKDSSSDKEYARMLGKRFGEELLVLNGDDSSFSMALENKAGGCITALANLYSNLSREIWGGIQDGMNVVKQQEKLSSLRKILEVYSPYPPILKAMMSRMYGFPLSPVKPPLHNVDKLVSDQAYNQFIKVLINPQNS